MSNARELAELGGSYGTGGFVGMKNRIINGAMVINQRGATVTANSGNSTPFCTDRWRATCSVSTATAFTLQQSSTAPAGFTKSLLATVTNNTSPSGGEVEIFYAIEGYNVADLGLGTADAKTFTLSFWVNSSVTGTYGVGFENTAGTYTYVGTYTVNSANTWEQKTITVAGSTAGTFDKTNDRGLTLRFDLGSGSGYEQAAGSWVNSGSTRNRTSGCVTWITNSGATFYITGVQLEKGSTATSFDFRSYGTELALCQRYFWNQTGGDGGANYASVASGVFNGTSAARTHVKFPVAMRAAPTMAVGGTLTAQGGGVAFSVTVIGGTNTGTNASMVDFTVSGATSGQGTVIYLNNAATNYLQASAEL
jgi:hypothetical protein